MSHEHCDAERAVIVRCGTSGAYRIMREGFYDYVSKFDGIESLLQQEGLLDEDDGSGVADLPTPTEAYELVERWEISFETADAIEQGSRLINPHGTAVGYWEFATLSDCRAWLRSSGSQPLW